MKVSLVCLVFAFGLSLSACGHFGKKGCCKSACTMEHGEHAKDAKACCQGECEIKK